MSLDGCCRCLSEISFVTVIMAMLSVATSAPQIHELQPDGEDAIRIGKLYLVDLAGSESILRYGMKLAIMCQAHARAHTP